MPTLARLIKIVMGSISSHENHRIGEAPRKVLDSRVAGTQSKIPRHPRVELLTVTSLLQNGPSGPHCVSTDATSVEALKVMAEHDVGAVLVLDGDRLTGTFSERDYARSSIRGTLSAKTILVGELMTLCDIFAKPGDSVQKCLKLMIDNRLQYLPVRDEGKLVGMLSLNDVLSEMVAYLEMVIKETELDQQIVFLRGTYSC